MKSPLPPGITDQMQVWLAEQRKLGHTQLTIDNSLLLGLAEVVRRNLEITAAKRVAAVELIGECLADLGKALQQERHHMDPEFSGIATGIRRAAHYLDHPLETFVITPDPKHRDIQKDSQ